MANLRKWSSSASGNATVAGGANTISFAEGQTPGSVNNSAREMMAQVRGVYTPDNWGWVEHSATASVASQTTFKISGNQTGDWTAGRRWRLKSGSTTRYGSVVSSSYTVETTVTVAVDSGSLSASHSLAALSAITINNVPTSYLTSASLSTALGAYLTSNSASAGYARLAAANTFTASQFINTGSASDAVQYLSADAGKWKYVQMRTGTAPRWTIGSLDNAETGSNAGSDFRILRYNDAGGYIADTVKITRSSGLTELESLAVSGNVGIGTTSPDTKLHVAGIIRASGTGLTAAFNPYNTTGGRDWRVMQKDTGAFHITDETASADRMSINTSGALGFNSAYGSSGEVLTSNGSSAAPSWQSAGASTAGLSAGAVGTYAYLRFNTLTTASADSTHAGSGLRYSNSAGGTTGGAPSGTWRLMGATDSGSTGLSTSLFLRIL